MFRFLRNIYLKIKRKLFYRFYGFYPEDVRKLVYVQKYLDKREHENKSYNQILKEEFKNAK